MKRYKPINLLDNKGFWPGKAAIIDGIREIVTLGRCKSPLPVKDFGRYRDPNWRDEDNKLVPYQSVDWYVCDALDEDRMQVDCEHILESFSGEPWRKESMLGDHYDLFVMEEDMFDPRGSDGGGTPLYQVGTARPFTAAVISTHRLEHIWSLTYGDLKTEVMRQMCFMFGVPAAAREDVAVEGSTAHCKNTCILRPAHKAPEDWDALTEIRLKNGPLCEACLADLRRFFVLVDKERRENG